MLFRKACSQSKYWMSKSLFSCFQVYVGQTCFLTDANGLPRKILRRFFISKRYISLYNKKVSFVNKKKTICPPPAAKNAKKHAETCEVNCRIHNLATRVNTFVLRTYNNSWHPISIFADFLPAHLIWAVLHSCKHNTEAFGIFKYGSACVHFF